MNRPKIEYFPTTEKRLYRDLVQGDTFTDPLADGPLCPLFDVDGDMVLFMALQQDGLVREYDGGAVVAVPRVPETKRLGECSVFDVVQYATGNGEEYLLYRALGSGRLRKLSLRTGAVSPANIGASVIVIGRTVCDG